MNGTKKIILPTLKIDLYYQPLIIEDVFEAAINFPPQSTPVGIVSQYCEHHNMSHISQFIKKLPWDRVMNITINLEEHGRLVLNL